MVHQKATPCHTFVICAYQESPFLEACIASVQNQSCKSDVLIATSTDNAHIRKASEKYGVEVRVSESPSNIARDWNFAYHQAKTPYVTIAHQDDIYCTEYAAKAVRTLASCRAPILFFSDYFEIRGGEYEYFNLNLAVKECLLLPMRLPCLRDKRIVKRLVLSFGNPICCPSVTYVKERMPYSPFSEGMGSNIDWQTWLRAADARGEFAYLPEALMGHRIHVDSTTSRMIEDNGRHREDLEMLRQLWPIPVAEVIGYIYRAAERSNR